MSGRKIKKHKPGPGWFYIGLAPVCEHESGVRIHTAGMYRKADGTIKEIPYRELSLYRRICGGNIKRAAMAWVRDNLFKNDMMEIK